MWIRANSWGNGTCKLPGCFNSTDWFSSGMAIIQRKDKLSKFESEIEAQSPETTAI